MLRAERSSPCLFNQLAPPCLYDLGRMRCDSEPGRERPVLLSHASHRENCPLGSNNTVRMISRSRSAPEVFSNTAEIPRDVAWSLLMLTTFPDIRITGEFTRASRI